MSKAEIFQLADEEGVIDEVLKLSHTCYQGSSKKNIWGRGCGICPACELRSKGYSDWIR